MSKFKFYFILMISGMLLFSCKDDDTEDPVPLRDFQTQYDTDNSLIETFLKTHYLIETGTPGTTSEMDVAFGDMPTGDPGSLVSLWLRPDLLSKSVVSNGVTYKLYYLALREGDATKESPSVVDEILVSYNGSYLNLDGTLKQFEYVPFPTNKIGLDQVAVQGWKEIFPLFKPGTSTVVVGEPTIYNNFGAGVIFIPSGLAYYNFATASIPSYVPLFFSFKLYDMTRSDQDEDGILSIYEDRNGNGIFTDDDTDGDGVPDYQDVDDDGDGKTTKEETKIPNSFPVAYYPYNGAAADDPTTTINETLGIPSCGDNPDYLSPTRLRRYIDPSCR